MYKPTFGQTTNTGGFGTFSGAANTSPFGQTSVFGKPSTSFGQPAFGTAGNSGLFGNALSSSGNLFGSTTTAPAFGQAQTTQQSFGFGATTQPTSNLFSSQQSTSTGLFGATATSAFGQSKPAFGSSFGTTGTTTGLFGSQPTNQTLTPHFGATPTGTATAFGASTSTFGVGTQQNGTVIKFNPISGTDTLQKGPASQQINTRNFCITCMKEYENKSLEELRFEDYAANRKGPQQAGLFGQTQAQPTLFGAAPNTGLFGGQQTENKSLFGATTTTLGGFGTSGGGVFGQQPATSTSLFATKPTGFGTSTASSTGFGFGSNANSLFNNTAQKPFGATTTPSLFGQSTAQPTTGFGATTGFPAFGQQQNQQQSQNNTIGLFGQQNKFSLGATTTQSTGFNFGATSTTGTSLFGSKPATTGFGTTGFGTTGSTFGAPATGTGLFNKTAPLSFNFGNTTGLGTGVNLNSSTSLFGNTQQKPGGLFNTGTSTGLFGQTGFGSNTTSFGATGLTSSTLGTNSMFGSTAPVPSTAAPAHSAILALASMPFATSPLFKNLLPATGKAELKPSNAVTQKAMLASKDVKMSPKADTKIKLKPLVSSQTKKSMFEGLEEPPSMSPEVSSSNVKRLTLKPRAGNSSLTETLSEAIANKENRRVSFSLPLETPRSTERENSDSEGFYIRRNPLFQPVTLSPQTTMNELEPAASSTIVETSEVNESSSRMSEKVESPRMSSDKSKSVDVSSGILDDSESFLNVTSRVNEDWEPHPTGIILRRLDYYTIPSLEELEPLVADDGSCIVENFCIGRHGYGNLYYEDTIDVAGLDIDSIVHFRHNEVNVYPDESIKPPVGEGLNRKCQVTLEQVWPLDKGTRELIRGANQLQEMGYEDKLRRCTNKMRAHFVEYRPVTGSWVFRVDHFSKYGLSDSEDEDEVVAVGGAAKPNPGVAPPIPLPVLKTPSTTILSPIAPPKQQRFSLPDPQKFGKTYGVSDMFKDRLLSTHDIDVDMEEIVEDDNLEIEMLNSPWSPSGGKLEPHRVQLMKSSIFHSQIQEDEDSRMLEMSGLDLSRDIQAAALEVVNQSKGRVSLSLSQHQKHGGHADELIPPFSPPLLSTLRTLRPCPKAVSVRHLHSVTPFEMSINGKVGTRFIADCALFVGRSFKVGWGPSSTLTCLSTKHVAERPDTDLGSRDDCDFSETSVQELSVYPDVPSQFKEAIEKHLIIQLEHTIIGEEEGCPLRSPSPGVEALRRHCLLATELDGLTDSYMTYSRQVWQLCAALWGDLPALSPQVEPTSHQSMMMRREALTEWLRACAEPMVTQEADGGTHLTAAFANMSGHAVPKACEILQGKGEHYTALLMCSGPVGKVMMQEQLREWTDVSADKFIDPERLRLYTVASGLPVLQTSQDILNACIGLDWRRVFAIHYWFLSSPLASISEVLSKYEEAFSGAEAYTEKPHPPYTSNVETSSGQVILDLCCHLLKLYSSRSYPLECLLNPATHTDDPLDCRLSWLLEQVLASLGYCHLSPLSSAITCISFAAQLEAQGLWHWSVFVCLHLKDRHRRMKAILEILGRHVVLSKKLELSREESFLTQELKVPPEWVYRAKATRALFSSLYDDATYYLIQAAEWNEAHQLFIAHIAPDLIINEKFDCLKELLEQLQPHSDLISEWPQQGKLLLDYLDIRRTVSQALEERDAGRLEEKLPQLASVCNRVLRWPTPTVKHRLCQAEIAKGTAHIYINVKRFNQSSSRDVKLLISKLPLPDDYLQELNELVNQAITVPH